VELLFSAVQFEKCKKKYSGENGVYRIEGQAMPALEVVGSQFNKAGEETLAHHQDFICHEPKVLDGFGK
jgi:hypothetical protein